MILKLDRTETAVLLYHLTLMRKSVRNTFKRNHKKESKGLLASYDDIKYNLECFIQEDEEKETFHFNVKEIKMLRSFLSSYIVKLEKTLQRAGGIMIEDQKQVDCLKDIEQRASALLGVVH